VGWRRDPCVAQSRRHSATDDPPIVEGEEEVARPHSAVVLASFGSSQNVTCLSVGSLVDAEVCDSEQEARAKAQVSPDRAR
jgi:hypothetical protein